MALSPARLLATLVLICAVAPAAGFQPLAGVLRAPARARAQTCKTGPGARMRPAVGAPLGLCMASGTVDPEEVVKRPINKLRFIQVGPPPLGAGKPRPFTGMTRRTWPSLKEGSYL